MSNGVPPLTFFEITAQLIPVLLLAVLLEQRLLSWPTAPVPEHVSRTRRVRAGLSEVFFLAFTLFFLIAGEVASLFAIAQDGGSRNAAMWVVGSLGLATTLMLLPLMIAPIKRHLAPFASRRVVSMTLLLTAGWPFILASVLIARWPK